MSFEKEIKNTINIDNIKDGLKKVDEAIENIKMVEKIFNWIKKLIKIKR